MISYEEALKTISTYPFAPGTESIELEASDGRILAEDVIADRDLPPYDRVTMDGIAIQFDSYDKGQRSFAVEKTIGAGMPKSALEDAGKCVQIMTGAIMPDGADTVIRYEDIELVDEVATIKESVNHKQNIHFKGEDKLSGEVVLENGTTLGPTEMIVAAAVGKATVNVLKLPKAAIITTGDELVAISDSPLAHQVRRSSNYGVQTVLQRWGLKTTQFHLKDDKEAMKEALGQILEDYELMVITGGVSRGKFDFLPEVLDELGVQKHFHKVKQRPGKPFWFGTAPNGTTVFALPGNPVSSFVCANVYIRHWLNASYQQQTELPKVKLGNAVDFKPPLTYFLECSVTVSETGQLLAHTFKGNGSGDFANMTQADGFVVLPEGKNHFEAGEIYPFIPYRHKF